MINEGRHGPTCGRAHSGCLIVLQPHHMVECFTNDLFGDHSGGHFTDPPRLIIERTHQRRGGTIRPGVEEATKRPDPWPVPGQSTVGTVDDRPGSWTSQNAQEMLINGAAVQDVDAPRDDGICSSTAALGLDALARGLLPTAAHRATLPRTGPNGNRPASGDGRHPPSTWRDGHCAAPGQKQRHEPARSSPWSGSADVSAWDGLTECCTPCWCPEGISEVLRLVHHIRMCELHDAHRVGGHPVVGDDALAYP